MSLAMLLPNRQASAQNYWTDGTGNWSVPGNWLAGVPGDGDIEAYISDSDGVSRTVTYDYTGPAVSLGGLDIDLTGGSGSATNTLSMSANNLTATGAEFVGFHGAGTFNQSGGTNAATSVIIASDVQSTGTYTLSGTGSLTVQSSESVGTSGTGYFNQSGGTNTVGNTLYVGEEFGSTGTYTLSGTGSLTAYDIILGGFGTGHFNQSGGTNAVSDDLIVGYNLSTNCSYTLSGGTLRLPKFMWVGMKLLLSATAS